ncbi:MAG: DsbA family protein [Gemmatimonadota bacterium]
MNWAAYVEGGHILGDKGARVTIVEFADFECPYCQRFARYVDSLTVLGIPVRVVYRHLPARSHRSALPAVTASECAAEQGRFESMHDALYANPESLGVASWQWFAGNAAVPDSMRFRECVSASKPLATLARDTADARRLKIGGTPTLLIHDLRYDGLPSFDSLRAYVERAGSTKRQ